MSAGSQLVNGFRPFWPQNLLYENGHRCHMNEQVWLYSSHILFSKSRWWTVSQARVEERERGTFGWAPHLALLPAPCVTPCVPTLGCAQSSSSGMWSAAPDCVAVVLEDLRVLTCCVSVVWGGW